MQFHELVPWQSLLDLGTAWLRSPPGVWEPCNHGLCWRRNLVTNMLIPFRFLLSSQANGEISPTYLPVKIQSYRGIPCYLKCHILAESSPCHDFQARQPSLASWYFLMLLHIPNCLGCTLSHHLWALRPSPLVICCLVWILTSELRFVQLHLELITLLTANWTTETDSSCQEPWLTSWKRMPTTR